MYSLSPSVAPNKAPNMLENIRLFYISYPIATILTNPKNRYVM